LLKVVSPEITPVTINRYNKDNQELEKMSEGKDRIGQVEWLAQQLKEKEAIIDGISDTLMLLDARTYKILEVNQAFLNSYGLCREEVLGKKCYEITHHLSTPCHHANSHCPCPVENTVATGNLSHVEHVHQDHDGNTFYFEITTYPLKDATGQISRIIHLSRDITLRKHLENEVKKSEEKYRTVFSSIPNPVFVLDVRSMKIIDCNDSRVADVLLIGCIRIDEYQAIEQFNYTR
jgi:PAS domain S-box-containing protein